MPFAINRQKQIGNSRFDAVFHIPLKGIFQLACQRLFLAVLISGHILPVAEHYNVFKRHIRYTLGYQPLDRFYRTGRNFFPVFRQNGNRRAGFCFVLVIQHITVILTQSDDDLCIFNIREKRDCRADFILQIHKLVVRFLRFRCRQADLLRIKTVCKPAFGISLINKLGFQKLLLRRRNKYRTVVLIFIIHSVLLELAYDFTGFFIRQLAEQHLIGSCIQPDCQTDRNHNHEGKRADNQLFRPAAQSGGLFFYILPDI